MVLWFYCGPFKTTEERAAQGFKCCPRCGRDWHNEASVHPRMRNYPAPEGVWPVEGDEKDFSPIIRP